MSSTYASRKRNRLVFLLIWTVVAGLVFGAAPAAWETPLMFLDAIVFVIVIIQWTYIDAAEHEFQLWRYFVPLMVICPGPVFVMPVYFIKSRGWGRGLATCGLALAFVVLLCGIDLGVSYVAILFVSGG